MSPLRTIALSLWAIMATVVHASIGSTSTHVVAPRFTISTMTSPRNATPTPSATAPGAVDALIYVRCDRFRVNEGKDAPHGNIWLDAYCHDDAGELWHSVINLNHCLQNTGGILQPLADGDFATTCWSPQLEAAPATYMIVYCYPGGNSDVLSINAEGDFECFGIRGCAWNHSSCTDKPDGVNG
ncbi:hypothetical protein PG994_000129 [Apiospora phragmitis]|uniref:Cyanovirin-N domain-containing protein n=1 Tax=Apiospora phragmitis TaxID=2905665 RepID=A0ABR1X5E5_9PEZI